MRKIGFLVQQDFLDVHFGVRNYFTTIMQVCAQKYQVDYLVHNVTDDGMEWYVCDSYSIPGAVSKNSTIRFDVKKSANYLKYHDYKQYMKDNSKIQDVHRQYFRCIGEDLSVENYDLLVITNPWLVDFEMRLPAKRLIGIVHDLIANQHSLTIPTVDFHWAHKHHRGYKYYNMYCDEIYANSEISSQIYNEYYHTDRCKFFSPFAPYMFKDVSYQGEKKENAVLLAAPFDPRKGISQMPELLNPVAEFIDILYIYGIPRCPENMFDEFFKKLHVKKISYDPYIKSDQLISLYKKCKVLLFPSLEEGLGLPIIEAQICGCRVVTTDKRPMNELCVEGSYVLKQNLKLDTEQMKQMICNKQFDYAKLSQDAKIKFSYNGILKVIDRQIEISAIT